MGHLEVDVWSDFPVLK